MMVYHDGLQRGGPVGVGRLGARMSRLARRFDMYVLGAKDVERLCAWRSLREVRFTEAQARTLRRVRKRNTSLFDALNDLAGRTYRVSSGVMEDVLHEAVMVNFRMAGHVRCLAPGDSHLPAILPAELLERTLYENGFYIGDVHFVPFIASASMSREDEYLFVNEERLDGLLRAASLDMVAADKGMPVLCGLPEKGGESCFGGLEENNHVASIPKLAAYLGLALSDGVSLREAWTAAHPGKEPTQADKAQWLLGLNEHNTVCVADWDRAPTGLTAFDNCWVNEELPRKPVYLRSAYSKQTEQQKNLQPVFLALFDEKEHFLEALKGERVQADWHAAIDRFFARGVNPPEPLTEDVIPRLLKSPQGVSVYHAAVLYAACLHMAEMDEGDVWLAPDADTECPEGALNGTQLKALVTELLADRALQERLWEMVQTQGRPLCTLLKTEVADRRLHVMLRRAPNSCYQAALRRIGPEDRFARGSQYDGCGFLDDELFDVLETMLRGEKRPDGEAPLNAVQIRLPWCKGLLVRFTAAAYFRQWILERGQQARDICIRDVFGCNRPLFDKHGNALVKAVFTKSMFKGASWFGALEVLPDEADKADRWAEYWRRLRLHDASILIAGRSTPPGRESRLNYQFLATLGLKPSEMERLAARRLHVLLEALQRTPVVRDGKQQDGVVRMAELLASVAPVDEVLERIEEAIAEEADDAAEGAGESAGDGLPEDEADGEDPEGMEPEDPAEAARSAENRHRSYAACLGRALLDNPEPLLCSDLIVQRFRQLVRSEVLQLMRGRLPVAGDVRYLLPDLLQMVQYMARKLLVWGQSGQEIRRRKGWDERVNGRKLADFSESVENSAINCCCDATPYGCYYAPGARAPWVKPARTEGQKELHLPVAMLRNPHYAMGEAPVLKPLPQTEREVYDHWFGHLTGCVMASAAAMYTVNGADCDGDRVNLCAEERVVTAICRNANRENALLARIVERREALAMWLKAQAGDARLTQHGQSYLRQMSEALPQILPAKPAGGMKAYWYSRPLVYAGSAAKGRVFSRHSMQGDQLRNKLWEAFCLSRKQRIGQMSLRVLQHAANAYGEDTADVAALDEAGLVSRFLARYLVISSALDTAMEIDMAKTGAKREDGPLKKVPAAVRRMLGLEQKSGFYAWLRLYKDREKRLKSYAFDVELRRLMRDFAADYAAPSMPMALDLLPGIIYRLWTPEAADKLWPMPTPEMNGKKERTLTTIRESDLDGVRKHSLRSRLVAPDPAMMALLVQPDGCQRTALGDLQQLLAGYDMKRRANAAVQKAETEQDRALKSVMRWLLMNGFSLDEAQGNRDLLQGVVTRWHEARRPLMMSTADAFRLLREQTTKEYRSVAWGWARTQTDRISLLDGMLAAALQNGSSLEAGAWTLTETEKTLLTCSRRSIVLVRLLAEYGAAAAQVLERADAGSAMPVEALEEDMRGILRKACGMDEDALFYAACHALKDMRYRDDCGIRRPLMSDFLLTYLLREQLSSIVAEPQQAPVTQAQTNAEGGD